MSEFNLPNTFGNRNPQVNVGTTNLNAASKNASVSLLPALLPVSIAQQGNQVKVYDLNSKLLATGSTSVAINQNVSAALSPNSESLILFSQRKNLFDAIISADLQKTILDATSKQPNITKLSTAESAQASIRNAVVLSVNNDSVMLKLVPPLGELTQVSLTPKNIPSDLKIGQQVQIQVQQLGDKWVAKLIVPKSTIASTPTSIEKVPLPPLSPSAQAPTPAQKQVIDIPVAAQAPLVEGLLKNVLQSGVNLSQTPKIVDALVTLLPKLQSLLGPQAQQAMVKNPSNGLNEKQSSQAILESIIKVIQQPSSAAKMTLSPNGQFTLSSQLPIAGIKLDQPIARMSNAAGTGDLQTLTKPVQHSIDRLFALPEKQRTELSEITKLFPVAKSQITRDMTTPATALRVDTSNTPENTRFDSLSASQSNPKSATPKALIDQLTTLIRQNFKSASQLLPNSKPEIPNQHIGKVSTINRETVTTEQSIGKDAQTKSIPNAKSTMPNEFAQQLSNLVRQHFVNAAPSNESASSLNQTLSQFTQSSDSNIRDLGKQIQQAILPLIAKKEPEPAQIQALLQMPAIPITTTSLAQISPVNNMVSGLVALLQISLATRLPQRQAGTSEKLGQALSQLIQTTTAASTASNLAQPSNQPTTNARVLQEFTQIEQRNQLLRTLSKTLSNHHYSKLASAEASLQGADSLFYSFPSYSSGTQRDIELLVKRETENNKSAVKNAESTSIWHLTMLMDIGEFGEMLSKCKLKEQEVSLDIYTSSEVLKIRVMDMLPILNKRLSAFGLNIVSSQCQLGKIPETLRPKPYQLLNTQA